jgi:hypothetical protein
VTDEANGRRSFLARWSQRKHAAARGRDVAADAIAPDDVRDARAKAADPTPAGSSDDAMRDECVLVHDAPAARLPGDVGAAGNAAAGPVRARRTDAPGGADAPLRSTDVPLETVSHDRDAAQLPAVDSLTFDSDFAPFMQRDVDADVRRAALKRLLHDTRFNAMDGLDVYIDDYSKPDPLPPGMLEQLAHVRAIFGPVAETVASDASTSATTPSHVDADSTRASASMALDEPDRAAEEGGALPCAAKPQPHDAALPCVAESEVGCDPVEADARPAPRTGDPLDPHPGSDPQPTASATRNA